MVRRRDPFSFENVPNPHGSPAAALARKERFYLMWRILSNMSVKQRVVFVLFEVEGYSGEEIAALEEVPLKTVWSRLASTGARRATDRDGRTWKSRAIPSTSHASTGYLSISSETRVSSATRTTVTTSSTSKAERRA